MSNEKYRQCAKTMTRLLQEFFGPGAEVVIERDSLLSNTYFYCEAHSCTIVNKDRTLICAIRHRRGDRHCGECDEGRKCLKKHKITESPHDLLFAKHNIPASPQTIPTMERYRNG